jgi:hypothetical protein
VPSLLIVDIYLPVSRVLIHDHTKRLAELPGGAFWGVGDGGAELV